MSRRVKIVSLLLATALATTLLTGCSSTKTDVVGDVKSSSELHQVVVESKPQKQVYEAYEHVFFKRYYFYGKLSEEIKGGQIEIPDGYEILEIETFAEKYGAGSQTGGFDIWFINNKPVRVESVYNGPFDYYDYSEPGKVIEEEKEASFSLSK